MKLPVIEINQDGNVFYISKIKARDLIKISTTKVRKNYTKQDYKNYLDEVEDRIEKEISQGEIWYLKDTKENTNIQRKKSEERLREIGKYISKVNSIFPNSIIIALNKKNEEDELDSNTLSISNNELYFDESKLIATIIDGQHRLGGFNYTDNKDYYLDNFELIITIMIDIEVALQAELFGTINGKQKPVSKSILYDLSELSEEEYTETVTAHLIAKWFNVDKKSPLVGKIKMLGYGEGTISQSAFIDALLPLIEEKKITKNNDRVFPVFRKFYLQNDNKTIMQNLYNYFLCFAELFPVEWNYELKRGDKVKYILNKTTGISGILFAYPTIFAYCKYHNNFKKSFILALLEKLKENGFSFTSTNYSGGSKSTQVQLADDILKTIFTEDEINFYRKKYFEKISL